MRSMTGFASLTHEDGSATIGVTVRTVNHRYLDLQLRLPSSLGELDARMRSMLQRRLSRGRVELSVSLQPRTPSAPTVELNHEFARALSAALEQARAHGLVEGVMTPGDLLRLPQAITVRDRSADADPEAEALLVAKVEAAVDQALADLDTMRLREGTLLRDDLDSRRQVLAELLERLTAAAEAGRADLEARLRERVREMRLESPPDETAVVQEIVRTAARSDITEEVTRFTAHLAHWSVLADGTEPCGRKLDFLLQEMNREINTIGSKADGVQVSELIISAKAELERMREQVQNVE